MATPLRLCLPLPLAVVTSCTFHSQADEWHDRMGVNGQPIRLLTTTKVGFRLFVLVPIFGDPSTANLIHSATERLQRVGGQRLRVVETESSNYWFALPPLSWFFSPVIGSVSIEYEPPAPPAAATAP